MESVPSDKLTTIAPISKPTEASLINKKQPQRKESIKSTKMGILERLQRAVGAKPDERSSQDEPVELVDRQGQKDMSDEKKREVEEDNVVEVKREPVALQEVPIDLSTIAPQEQVRLKPKNENPIFHF